MILATILAAHLITWPEVPGQVGIAIGTGPNERLIFMIPREGCGAGMKIFSGRWGDFEAAERVLLKSRACS